MLCVYYHQMGFLNSRKEYITARIYVNTKYKNVLWNDFSLASFDVPIYRDGDAKAVLYPCLLGSCTSVPADLNLVVKCVVKFFIPIFGILERNSNWTHSVVQTWAITGAQLVVTSTRIAYNSRLFSISVDSSQADSSKFTVNGVEHTLDEFDSLMTKELGIKLPKLPFGQQYSELDVRIECLLRSNVHTSS